MTAVRTWFRRRYLHRRGWNDKQIKMFGLDSLMADYREALEA